MVVNSFSLFGERPAFDYLRDKRRALEIEIRQTDGDYMLGVNEEDFISHLVSKYAFDTIEIDWTPTHVTQREVRIPGDDFPWDFNVMRDQAYPKQVVTYHLSVSGDTSLLKCKPSGSAFRVLARPSNDANNLNSIGIDVINFYDDAAKVKAEWEKRLTLAKNLHNDLRSALDRFNADLRKEIGEQVTKRRAEHLKRANMLEALGVPIKKANAPQAFTVPAVKRRLVVQRPAAPSAAFTPEPTLDKAVYEAILTDINRMGDGMERHPALYEGRNEEGLRDQFLLMLSLNYDSADGEAFNKGGDTDILVRHATSVVFVAECKIWGGQKAYLAALDQLFGYLTWRDSKVALVVFVDRQVLSGVLEAIEKATPKHSCFVSSKGKVKEGWFDYEFHLPGDSNRHVSVAVLVFHFPKASMS